MEVKFEEPWFKLLRYEIPDHLSLTSRILSFRVATKR